MAYYIIRLIAIFLVSSTIAWSQSGDVNWKSLANGGKVDEARKLCDGLVQSKEVSDVVEGHKCLANLELRDAPGLQVQANDVGGGELGPGYPPAAIDAALAHLNTALKLAPQDLSIHQGRLYVLEISYRFDAMAKALEESCNIYKGEGVPDAWIAYSYELGEDRQLKAAVNLLQVLDKHYPNNHDIVGNIGAMYSMLREDENAIQYLKRAVALAPEDPIDNWNLGRMYDYSGRVDLADQYYKKAMKIDTDGERLKGEKCIYGEFVAKKLDDPKRGCELQTTNCPEGERTACEKSK